VYWRPCPTPQRTSARGLEEVLDDVEGHLPAEARPSRSGLRKWKPTRTRARMTSLSSGFASLQYPSLPNASRSFTGSDGMTAHITLSFAHAPPTTVELPMKGGATPSPPARWPVHRWSQSGSGNGGWRPSSW
jgi:hypothetical protein